MDSKQKQNKMDVFYLLSIFPVALIIMFIAMYLDGTCNAYVKPTKSSICKPIISDKDKDKENKETYEWDVKYFF